MSYNREDLYDKTVAELREMCIQRGISGMSKKRKDEIVDALLFYNTPSQSKEAVEPLKEINAELDIEVNGPKNYNTTVRVSCGAASGNFPVVGRTVGAVSEILREVLNVDRMSSGVVNGKSVSDSYVLKNNDALEFVKPAGRKGSSRHMLPHFKKIFIFKSVLISY